MRGLSWEKINEESLMIRADNDSSIKLIFLLDHLYHSIDSLNPTSSSSAITELQEKFTILIQNYGVITMYFILTRNIDTETNIPSQLAEQTLTRRQGRLTTAQ